MIGISFRFLLRLVFAWWVFWLASCGSQKDNQKTADSTVDGNRRMQTLNEVLTINDQFNEFIKKKDLNSLLHLYDSSEIYWLPPNGMKKMGMQSVRGNYSYIIQTPEASLWHVADQLFIAASGEYATMIGSYHFRLDQQPSMGDDGKYVLQLRKKGKEWRIVSDIYNSNFSDGGEKKLVDKPIFFIYTHKTQSPGSVNAYLIVLPEGVVLIDALRTTGEARELVQAIKSFERPLLGIIITHGHPDHIGGLQHIAAQFEGVPIFSSKSVKEEISTDSEGYIKSAKRFIGSDFGDKVPVPNRILDSTLSFGNLSLKVKEFRDGEAKSLVALQIVNTNVLFSSDLINYNMVPYLVEGNTTNWGNQLNDLVRDFDEFTVVYPGHGLHGSILELTEFQRNYIMTIKKLVSVQLAQDLKFTRENEKLVLDSLEAIYGEMDYVTPSSQLNEMNVKAVVKEIRDSIIKSKN